MTLLGDYFALPDDDPLKEEARKAISKALVEEIDRMFTLQGYRDYSYTRP